MGSSFPAGLGLSIEVISHIRAVVGLLNPPTAITPSTQLNPAQWSPPQWGKEGNNPQTAIVYASGTQVSSGLVGQVKTTSQTTTGNTMLVFDAVIRADHNLRLTKTQHPVQGSANVTDHAYLEPARVVLEIGMSDVMQAYPVGGIPVPSSGSNSTQTTYTSPIQTGSGKSVSAFQLLKSLRDNRTLVSLVTRLNTYKNMLVADVQASDTYKTRFGLRAIITLEEVFVAGPASQAEVPARPNTTSSTQMGTVQPGAIPAAVSSNNMVTDPASQIPGASNFQIPPGAGIFSSNNILTLLG